MGQTVRVAKVINLSVYNYIIGCNKLNVASTASISNSLNDSIHMALYGDDVHNTTEEYCSIFPLIRVC